MNETKPNQANVFFSGSKGAIFAESTTLVLSVAAAGAEGVDAEKGREPCQQNI